MTERNKAENVGLLVFVASIWFVIKMIQLFRERLSYKPGKTYATVSQVIMGNCHFYGCLSEPQGVSAWWKETAQTHLFVLSLPLLLSHLSNMAGSEIYPLAPPPNMAANKSSRNRDEITTKP